MDKRVDCKYGEKCYQKNPEHHKKYKHPDKKADSSDNTGPPQNSKEVPASQENTPKTSPTKKDKSPESRSPLGNSPKRQKRDSEEKPSSPQKEPKEEAEKPNAAGRSASPMDITEEYNEVMKNVGNKNYFEIFQKRVRYSQKAEYQDLLKTPEIFIRHKFLVEMPEEFYTFWKFCESIATENGKPQEVFSKVGLKLVGPFDYLAGTFHNAKILEPAEYLRHWRFFYDPPEFQTIFVKAKSELHYGYWRDDPKDKEDLLIARNDSTKGCEFEFVGENCFSAILYYLENDCDQTPFNRSTISNLKKSIVQFVEEHKIKVDNLAAVKKRRDKNVVCKAFHRAGIVVPFDRKTDVGYRQMMVTEMALKKILERFKHANGDKTIIEKGIDALHPIVNAASIATDECDFGTALELGIDLFCSGYVELHSVINTLLITAYALLHRPQFIAILKAHLESRQKGSNLSILE